jgi:hypothetical protein
MRRVCWTGAVLLAGLSTGCWGDGGLSGWHLTLWEPHVDDAIVASSLTQLAGDGALYLGAPPGTVARSWAAHLKRLGLEARLDDGGCIHSATPDGHPFTITVFTSTEEAAAGEHTRAYLAWQEKAYSTRGWQTLADLEHPHPPPRVSDNEHPLEPEPTPTAGAKR